MANGVYDPNMQVPPELLRAMLELSTADDQSSDLDKQLALSEALTKGAVNFEKGPSNAVGGAAYALGKGLAGYAGGTMYRKNRDAKDKLREMQRTGRGAYFNAVMAPAAQPAQQGNPIVPPNPEDY